MNLKTKALAVFAALVAVVAFSAPAQAVPGDPNACSAGPDCEWTQGSSVKTTWWHTQGPFSLHVWYAETDLLYGSCCVRADITTDFFQDGRLICHFIKYSGVSDAHTCTGYFGKDHTGYTRTTVDVHNDGAGYHRVWDYYGYYNDYNRGKMKIVNGKVVNGRFVQK